MSGVTLAGLPGRFAAVAAFAAAGLGMVDVADAVPSFARQTGMACEACHTVFPELTHFGRVFKANGYILQNLKQVRDVTGKKEELLELSQTPALSMMAMVSYTQLNQTLPDVSIPGAQGLSQSGTAGFPQQLSLFYAGKIAPHFGAWFQLTYSNASGSIGIDNSDLRFTDTTLLPDNSPLTYGLSVNNNPTVQDLWNSTPAFGFPYAVSNAGVSPAAASQIDGPLAQQVAGLTAYAFWNESLYAEFGGYRSAIQGNTNTLTGAAGPLDGSASNVIQGLSPYWRVAFERNWQRNSLELGVYGASFRERPGAAAAMPLSGPSNQFKDVAEDFQYQFIGEEHILTVAGTHIHENMTLDATFADGLSANPSDSLNSARLWATYYYRRRIGGTIGHFQTTGSTDALLYAPNAPGGPGVVTSANGSPQTAGWIAEANYLPWLNVKLSAQYIAYSKFNGGSSNYDGAGRTASGNNTLYLLLWFAY